MPNTLCHIGFQTPFARLRPGIDLRLVVIACVIPDIPWIIQRIFIKAPFVDAHVAQLYFIIQASLLFCCLLCAALAIMTARPLQSFLILSGNCLFHLLLDACQIKLANGVHLFAPFSWKMLHFDLSWPENPVWPLMSIFGCGFLLYNWQSIVKTPLPVAPFKPWKAGLAALLTAIYLAGPLLFLSPVEQLDNAYLDTLHRIPERSGKYIEFDRLSYLAESKTLITKTGEHLHLSGTIPDRSGLLSIQGHFRDQTSVQVDFFHQHSKFRDYASMLGIFMACALLTHSVILARAH